MRPARSLARVAGVLAGRGLEPAVLPPEQVHGVEEYDAAVLGSAVYAGRWLEPAKELVRRYGDELARRPVWLFSTGPVGDPSRKLGAVREDAVAAGART